MHSDRRSGIAVRRSRSCRWQVVATVYLLLVGMDAVLCEVPDEVVTAQRGEPVMLTCPIDVTSCGELHSVKWFKGNDRVAVVSGDGAVENVEGPFTGRMTIGHKPKGPASTLHVKSVQVQDEDTYVCETTFLEPMEYCENSGSYSIGLQVHVPPLSIRMLDETATPIANSTTLGPLREGHRWTSTCEVRGTRPNPQVGWYRAGKRLIDSVATDESDGLFTVRSVISLVLSRQELGAFLECRVESPAVPNLISNQLHLNLNVRPTKVQLSGLKPHISRGIIVQAICLVTGARPAANITWFNNTQSMDASRKTDRRNISTKTELRNDGTFTTLSKLVFTASRFENGASIRCEADNAVHQNDSAPARMQDTFTMAVLYPPVVTIKPSNVTVNETGEFQLGCDYEANPSVLKDVKWLRDGKLVDLSQGRVHKLNKEGTSILVKEASRNDIGSYQCELENTQGKGTADNEIDIDVFFVPIVELTMDPNNTIIENNESNVTLFCNVIKGNPSQLLKVRWFLDGQILKELPECADNEIQDDEPLCGVNPNVLLLENVGREFLGNYSCEGMNAAGWGRRSKENELVVYFEPGNATLSHHPLVATKKKSVTFKCSVDDVGYPKATRYRWLRGGSPVMDVVTPVWTVDPVGLDSRTNFSCYAYNEGGKGNPATVQLDVKAPQAFIQKLHPYTGALFSTPAISLSCRVECVPACEIAWFKDGVGIEAGNDHYYIKNTYLPAEPAVGDFESVLSVLHFNMSAWPDRKFDILRDNANYSCASSSQTDGPGVRSATYFGVEYPPENTDISSAVVDVEQGSHPPRVSCSAKAYPEPSYVWRRNGQVLAKGNVLYIFRNMSTEDDGLYECVAFNKHGNTSAHMHMNVLYKPNCTITRKEINSEDTLVCTAVGNPSEINFDWTMHSDNETVVLPEVRKSQSGNSSTSFLTLGDDFAVQRTYRCMTNNSLGAGPVCEIDVAGHILWWQRLDKLTLYVLLGLIIALLLAVIIVCIIIICICRKRRRQNKYHTDLSISATQSDLLFTKPRQQIATAAAPQRPPPPPMDALGLPPPPPSATAEVPKSPPKWPLRPGVMVHVRVDTKQNLCAARAQSPLAQRHNAAAAPPSIGPLDATTNSNGVNAANTSTHTNAIGPTTQSTGAATSSSLADTTATTTTTILAASNAGVKVTPSQSPDTTMAIYASPHNVSYASSIHRTPNMSSCSSTRQDKPTSGGNTRQDNNDRIEVVAGGTKTTSSPKRTPPPPPPRNFRDKSTGSRVNISANKLQQLLQHVNFGLNGKSSATGLGIVATGGGDCTGGTCISDVDAGHDNSAVVTMVGDSEEGGEMITLTRTRLIERILGRWPRRRPKQKRMVSARDEQEMCGDEELGCRPHHQQQQRSTNKGTTVKKRSVNLLRRSVRLFGSGKSTNSGTALFDKCHHIAGLSSGSDGVVTYKRTPVAPVRPVVVVADAVDASAWPTEPPPSAKAISSATTATSIAPTTSHSCDISVALSASNYNDKSSVAGDPLTEPGEYEILPFNGMGANNKFRSNCASTTKRDVVRVAPQPKHPSNTYSYNLASSFPASFSSNNFHPSPNNVNQLHHTTPANYPNFQITSMNYTNYPTSTTNTVDQKPPSNDCGFVSAAATQKPNGGASSFRNGFLSASASAFNPFLSKAARASKKPSKCGGQLQQQQQRFNSLKSMGAKNAPEFHSMRANKCKRHHSFVSSAASGASAVTAPDAHHQNSSSAMPYISQQFQSLDAQMFQPLYENLTDSIQIHEASLCTNDDRSNNSFQLVVGVDGGRHEYRAAAAAEEEDADDDQLQRNSLYRSDSGISNSSYECVTPVPAPRTNPRKCQSAPVYMNLPGKGHRRVGGGGSGRSSKGKGGGSVQKQHHKCRNEERTGGGEGTVYTYERSHTNPFISPGLRKHSQTSGDEENHRKPLVPGGNHSLSQHAVNGLTSHLVPSSSSSSSASAASNTLSTNALSATRRPVKLPLRKHHTFHFQSSQTVAGARNNHSEHQLGSHSSSKANNRKHYRNNGPLVFKPFSEETAFKPITPVPKSPSQHASTMIADDVAWSMMDQQHYLGHNGVGDGCSTMPSKVTTSLKRHKSNVETFHARVVTDEDEDSSPPSSSNCSSNRVGRKLHYADLAPLSQHHQQSISNSSTGSTGSGSARGGTSTAVIATSSSSNDENSVAAMQMKMYGRPRQTSIVCGSADSPKRATQYATLKYNEVNM